MARETKVVTLRLEQSMVDYLTKDNKPLTPTVVAMINRLRAIDAQADREISGLLADDELSTIANVTASDKPLSARVLCTLIREHAGNEQLCAKIEPLGASSVDAIYRQIKTRIHEQD